LKKKSKLPSGNALREGPSSQNTPRLCSGREGSSTTKRPEKKDMEGALMVGTSTVSFNAVKKS